MARVYLKKAEKTAKTDVRTQELLAHGYLMMT